MPSKCVVPGCNNTSRDTTGISYHSFPDDPVLKKVWQKKTAQGPTVGNYKSSTVCSDHFNEEDFEDVFKEKLLLNAGNIKRRLKKGVIPSRNLPNTETVNQSAEVVQPTVATSVASDSVYNKLKYLSIRSEAILSKQTNSSANSLKRRRMRRDFNRRRLRNLAETVDSDAELEKNLLQFMEGMRELESRKEENVRMMVTAVTDCCNQISKAFVNVSKAANVINDYYTVLTRKAQGL